MGEILMGESLARGLGALGHRVHTVGRLRELAVRRLRSLGRSDPPLLFVDRARLAYARRAWLLGARQRRCCFVLDWFGTSSGDHEIERLAIDPSRCLAAYPDGISRFLGFVLSGADGAPIRDRADLSARLRRAAGRKGRQGVLWAKEARYLEGERRDVVEWLASRWPIHATISSERGGAGIPKGVINHGHLSRTKWHRLLGESAFVVGVGDPILGPTALEALAAGCAYVDPSFSPARVVGARTMSSQHPYAASIGPPFVWTVPLADRAALGESLEQACRGEDRASTEQLEILASALEPFSEAAYRSRLDDILRAWACSP